MIKLYVEEILSTISKIEMIILGTTFEEFQLSHSVDDIVKYIGTIGEAVKYVPEDLRTIYPEIPWEEMIDYRNIIFKQIDLNKVWRNANDLIALKSSFSSILNNITE